MKGALIVVAGVCGLQSVALAQRTLDPYEQMEEAARTFERGRIAYERGDYREAMAAFRRSHELTRSPDILYNIALVAEQLNQPSVAIDAYQEYLQQRPHSESRQSIRRRLQRLRARGRGDPRLDAGLQGARSCLAPGIQHLGS